MSLSRRLFCPTRIMGRSGFESISNWQRVWISAKTSRRMRLASSMTRRGTCFLWAVSLTMSLIILASFERELRLWLISRPMQICRSISIMDPVEAITGITLY